MGMTGGCRCGAVRYDAWGDPKHHGVCHCTDCRRSSGAPAVSFIAMPSEGFGLTKGAAKRWDGDNGAERYFCDTCGTPLYYINEGVLPGIVDLHSSTLDDPEAVGAPGAQIQCAERLSWMAKLDDVPAFDRWPG